MTPNNPSTTVPSSVPGGDAAGAGVGATARAALGLLAAVLVLLSGVLAACSKAPGGSGGAGGAGPGGKAAVARSVQVASVDWRRMERIVTVTGSLLAREEATLSVKVPGRLRSLQVDLGSEVRAGEVIAQVEPADYEIRLRQAEAAVAQARAMLGLPLEGTNDAMQVESASAVREAQAVLDEAGKNRDRVRNLSGAGVVAPSELDAVEASYKVALNRYQSSVEEARTKLATLGQRRAELAFAQKQLSDTSMRAPFDGVIQRREAGVGEYVAAGTPIVTLVRPDPLRLRIEVPERDSGGVRHGQLVRLRVEGHTNRWSARIERLSPALNEANRMLVVEADVPGDGTLRPGLFVRADIVVADDERGLAVPASAVVAFAGLEKTVVVQDGKVTERTVTTGRTGPGWVEVKSGLKAGDQVVLEPGGLRTGQAVTVSPGAPPPSAATSAVTSATSAVGGVGGAGQGTLSGR